MSLIVAGLAGGTMLISMLASSLGLGGPQEVSPSASAKVDTPVASPTAPQKLWSARVVWKAPERADEAIKSCKDWNCLYGVLQQHAAPAETVEFLRAEQAITPTDDIGYPTAFRGKGKVKAVEIFYPGLGMEGSSEFLFVNGPDGIFRPKIDFEAMARESPEYQRFKSTYPQVAPWDSMAYLKEVRAQDGAQEFQFTQTLLNGCHACALLGTAQIALNFDRAGQYVSASIIGVEPDEGATYNSIKDELSQKSQFFQSMTVTKADGSTETAQVQTIISDSPPPSAETQRCKFTVNMNPTMTSGWFMYDETFDMMDVAISRPSSPNSGYSTARSNALTISCKDSSPCITPIYSDQRGAQPPVPSATLIVPPENVDIVIADFEKIQAMCRPGQ